MNVKKQLINFLLSTIALIVLLCVCHYYYNPVKEFLFGSRHAKGLGYRRVVNIVHIRTALMQYKEQNGHYPNQLSDLIPQYINPNNIEILYGPIMGINKDWFEKRKSFINSENHFDKNFPYLYFGDDGVNKGMILCEKPDMWQEDKQIAPDVLCILFPDGSVKSCNLLKRKELGVEAVLQERLNQHY